MAIELRSTRSFATNGVKVLVYGEAGVGKTSLVRGLPDPVILSAEGGLLSVSDTDFPFIEIGSMAALGEAYAWLIGSEEANQFQSVVLDSISEIAEVCLSDEKRDAKDPRQAYGAMQEAITAKIRSFRDIPGKHVYMSAKVEHTKDELGSMLYAPSMPGNKLGQSLPYFFDEVLALRLERDNEGIPRRVLQTQPDGLWQAKDRSGRLDAWEAADNPEETLKRVIGKIAGTYKNAE
jgi:phage nucleotide-binding protein